VNRLFLTVLGILIPLIVLEMVARIVVSLEPPVRFGWVAADETVRLAMQSATHPTHKCILILGDSLASNGIYSELLSGLLSKDGTTVDVINLATGASRIKDDVFFGQLALDSGCKPDLVITDVWPHMLSPERSKTLKLTSYSDCFAGSLDGHYIVCPPRNIQEKADQELRKWSSLWEYRGYLKTFLFSLPQRVFLAPPLGARHQMLTSSDFGWHPVAFTFKSDADWSKAIQALGHLVTTPYDKKTGEAVVAPLKTFCAQRNLPLLIVCLPRPKELLDESDKSVPAGCDEDTIGLLAGLADRKGTSFMDLGNDQNPEHYWDGVHLNAAGSVEATYRLAKAIKAARLDSFVPPH
jgi:hypothetical protein